MKRKFSESSEKVEMETKLEDVPDDPEGRDQIRINLLIKEPQIIEVRLKLLFLSESKSNIFQFRTFCTQNQLNIGGAWKILPGCPYGSPFGPHFISSLIRFM